MPDHDPAYGSLARRLVVALGVELRQVDAAAVLLLDASLSMRGDRLAAALAGARTFVGGMARLDLAKLLLFSDRVGPGGCPPGPPTDPDVPDSGIRLLGLWRRCATVNTVNNTRCGKRIALGQTDKLVPRHAATPRAAMQPLAPQASDFVEKAVERASIAGDAVVGTVALELAAQSRLLDRHRPVTIRPAPVTDFP